MQVRLPGPGAHQGTEGCQLIGERRPGAFHRQVLHGVCASCPTGRRPSQSDTVRPLAVVHDQGVVVAADRRWDTRHGGLGVQAHHLGTGPAVVAQRHRAHRVHARVQHHSGGVHPVRHPEQVDRQAHRVDAQVHERAARHGRVEGRRHRARAVGVHPGGVLLLDQHRTAHRPQPPQVLAHHGHTRFEGRQPALHQQPVGLPSSRHHGTGLRWRHREGLLHEHVPPRPQRRDRVLGMEDVGAAHVDHVHGVLAAGRQHLVQRGVRGGQTVLGGEGCRPLRPRRGHPDDPGVIHHGHRLGEPLRDEPGADDAEPDGGGW